MRGAAAAYGNEVYDDYEDPAYVPSQRVSGRRKTPGVDFSKLTLAALRRYRQVFQLGDIPGGAKEDLLPAIQRHFAQQVVDEAEILIAFASRVRRQSLRQTSPLPAAKKPRGVAKPLR